MSLTPPAIGQASCILQRDTGPQRPERTPQNSILFSSTEVTLRKRAMKTHTRANVSCRRLRIPIAHNQDHRDVEISKSRRDR